MKCTNCDGTETVIHDGVEYCSECHSQYKGSQTEEASDESFSQRVLLSSPGGERKSKAKDRSIFYQPWISTEAYNLIIAKQVSELIKLGCSEKLKDVVFHIWAQYLQKCEVAFSKSDINEDDTPHLSAFAIKRDAHLLYGDGKIDKHWKESKKSVKLKSVDTLKKNSIKLENDFDQSAESQESSSADESSISCSSNDLLSTGVITDERENSDSSTYTANSINSVKKQIKFSEAAQKYMALKKIPMRKTVDTIVHHMTLAKTLSFCHLGLLYTKDQLLLFDLIRLINEGNVPFIDVTRHFPPSMQLQDGDHSSYTRYVTPGLHVICKTSSNLMDLLQLPKFKHPSLLPIAVRFVKDLNLPNDIIPALKVVIEDLESKRSEWYSTTEKSCKTAIPMYEVQAMAAIIVVLKMLLVLDGNFEVEHDEIMAKLNIVVEEDHNFFIWDEWKQQAKLKEYLFLRKGFNYTEMSCLDSLCTDRIIGRYPYCCSKPDQSSNLSNESKKEHSARNTLKHVLEPITTVNPLKGRPTSFPLRFELQRLMTEWERLPIYQDTQDIDFGFISRDFSRDSFCYKPFVGSTASKDLINVLFSSLYESAKLLHVFPRGGYYRNILRTSKKYWHANILRRTLFADCKKKWLEELPSSFKWLLMFLSKYLEVDCAYLYLEVKYIEQKLFK